MTDVWDAIVIGGGPAGSSVATYLAREKRRVLLLERESFPREHIGESLLPGVLPYLDALGAREAIEAAGFERKEGQTFVWGRDRTPWEIDFRELDVYPYAYFVDRARFDEILLRHAQRLGAEVRERARVLEIVFTDGRATGVELVDANGKRRRERARFVVDASGQSALVARKSGLRRNVAGLRNLAFWAYFEGARRMSGHQRAHILTTSIPDGWIWVIPLGDRTSVGVVTSRATREQRDADTAVWFERAVFACAPVAELLAGARRVTEIRSARDWSYRSSRTSGPGIFLAGDAACFIDPILSTGVHLAMTSGYWAAACVHSALAQPTHEPLLRRFYDQTYLRTYRELLTQVKSFYRAEGRRDSIYWTSNQLLRMGDSVRSDLAFLFITAGLLRNAAFETPSDVAAQVERAIGVDAALANAWSETRRAGHRRDVSPPMVWRAGGGQLVTLRAEGLRLIPVRYEPAAHHDRPRGSYFVIEVNDRDQWPVGLIMVENGAAVRAIAYGEDDLRAVRIRVEQEIAGSTRASASLRRRVRAIALPDGYSWARASELRGGGLEEPPLTVVLEHANASAPAPRVYLVLEARLPPEIVDVPLLRTPHIDVWIRPGTTREGAKVSDLPDVRALIARVRAFVRGAPRTRQKAFAAIESSIAKLDLAPYRVVAVGRLGS